MVHILYHGYNDSSEFWENRELTLLVAKHVGHRVWRAYRRKMRMEEYAYLEIEAPICVDVISRLSGNLGDGVIQDRGKEWTYAGEGNAMVLRDANPAIV